jgi:hypothetical protein
LLLHYNFSLQFFLCIFTLVFLFHISYHFPLF